MGEDSFEGAEFKIAYSDVANLNDSPFISGDERYRNY